MTTPGGAGPGAAAAPDVAPSVTRPVLLCFCARWSPHCVQMSPVLEEVTREFAGRVDVVPVDTTTPAGHALASNSGVTIVPTFLLLRRGREVARIVGAVPKGHLRRALEDVVTPGPDGVAH